MATAMRVAASSASAVSGDHAGATAVIALFGAISFLGNIAVTAVLVYLTGVRPKVAEIHRGHRS